MKKAFILIFVLATTIPVVRAQSGSQTPVEVMPQFPGGQEELAKYFQTSIRYPKEALRAKKTGVVYANFTVDEKGSISEMKVIRGFDKSCEVEALRVIRNMPAWSPGRKNGKPVSMELTLPVRFEL